MIIQKNKLTGEIKHVDDEVWWIMVRDHYDLTSGIISFFRAGGRTEIDEHEYYWVDNENWPFKGERQ